MYTSKTEQQCMCVRLPGLERRVREHLWRAHAISRFSLPGSKPSSNRLLLFPNLDLEIRRNPLKSVENDKFAAVQPTATVCRSHCHCHCPRQRSPPPPSQSLPTPKASPPSQPSDPACIATLRFLMISLCPRILCFCDDSCGFCNAQLATANIGICMSRHRVPG